MRASKTPARKTPCSRNWPGALALILGTVVVYWPCLSGPFLWDDRDWTLDAEWFMGSLAGLWQIWTNPTCLQQYYPVTATSFWIDHHLWGYHTFPYHLENVLLHGLSAVLFWQLLKKLGVPGAWLAASLLVVHPVMVESVAWITERKNAICLTLFLASMLAYGRFAGWWPSKSVNRSWPMYALALALFALAMLAKVTAFVLPPALLLVAWWKRGRLSWRRDLRPALPFFALAIALGSLVAWIEKNHLGAKGSDFDLPFLDRVILSGQTFWFYAVKLLWPRPICVIYDRWPLDSQSGWQWIPTLGILLAAVLLWRFRARIDRGVFVALLFFSGALIPVLGFMNVYGMRFAWVADRWTYLPALGVFAVVAAGVARLPRHPLRDITTALALATLGILTWRQAENYADTDRFWQTAIAGNRAPWKAHNEYGVALLDAGRPDEAIEHLREAVRLAPGLPDAHSNLGSTFLQLGDPNAALKAWETALEIRPDFAPAHYNMGITLGKTGEIEKAVRHLKKAVEIQPTLSVAHIDLGNILFLTNRIDEAEAHFLQALEIRPGHPSANTAMGNVRFRQGRPAEALRYYEKALARAPDQVQALSNCAWIRATSTRSELRDGARAVELGEKAVSLAGDNDPSTLESLAAAYAEAGRYEDAARVATKALKLAEAQGRQVMAGNLRQELTLYESSRPIRDNAGGP